MRKTGRTTRLVDFVIQSLFKEGQITIAMVDEKRYTHLLDVLLRRLHFEHDIDKKDLQFINLNRHDEKKDLIESHHIFYTDSINVKENRIFVLIMLRDCTRITVPEKKIIPKWKFVSYFINKYLERKINERQFELSCNRNRYGGR